jgi:hypothetical protein
VGDLALNGVTSDSEEHSRSVVHILYRSNQLKARGLLEEYKHELQNPLALRILVKVASRQTCPMALPLG